MTRWCPKVHLGTCFSMVVLLFLFSMGLSWKVVKVNNAVVKMQKKIWFISSSIQLLAFLGPNGCSSVVLFVFDINEFWLRYNVNCSLVACMEVFLSVNNVYCFNTILGGFFEIFVERALWCDGALGFYDYFTHISYWSSVLSSTLQTKTKTQNTKIIISIVDRPV